MLSWYPNLPRAPPIALRNLLPISASPTTGGISELGLRERNRRVQKSGSSQESIDYPQKPDGTNTEPLQTSSYQNTIEYTHDRGRTETEPATNQTECAEASRAGWHRATNSAHRHPAPDHSDRYGIAAETTRNWVITGMHSIVNECARDRECTDTLNGHQRCPKEC